MSKKISNPLRSAAVGAAKKGMAVKEQLKSGLNVPREKLKDIKEEAREAYEKEKKEKAARPKKKRTTVKEKGTAVKKRLKSGLNVPGEKLKDIREGRAVARIKKTHEEVEKLDSYIEEFEKKLKEKKAPAVPKKPAPKAKKAAKKPAKKKAPAGEEVPEAPPKKVIKDELAWIYSS